MDFDTEKRIIRSYGEMAMIKGRAEDIGGLTEFQEAELNQAMLCLSNLLLDEEASRKRGGWRAEP